jgi:predicted membrane metal-binding protein
LLMSWAALRQTLMSWPSRWKSERRNNRPGVHAPRLGSFSFASWASRSNASISQAMAISSSCCRCSGFLRLRASYRQSSANFLYSATLLIGPSHR